MKALRFLFVFALLSAFVAVQDTNAQAEHVDGWTHDFSVEPISGIWGIDEIIVDGIIKYDMIINYNKDGSIKKIHFQNKGTLLTGISGTVYKYIDLVAQGGDLSWPEPPLDGEAHFVGHLKVIALGEGVVYNIRVDILIKVDKDGNVIVQKYILIFE